MKNNDRQLQAPWVGKSDWDYFGWEAEEEAEAAGIAYWENIDRLIDEEKDNKVLKEMEKNNDK